MSTTEQVVKKAIYEGLGGPVGSYVPAHKAEAAARTVIERLREHQDAQQAEHVQLIDELRAEAITARASMRPDPEGYGRICDLPADEELLDRAARALSALLLGRTAHTYR